MDWWSDEPRISASERDPARRDQPGTKGRPLAVEYRCSTLLRDNDLGQPVGSHGGRHDAGIDGWLNSDFLYLNETAPRWERLRTRSSTHGVNNSRHPPRLDPSLELLKLRFLTPPAIRSPRGTPWDVTAGVAWQALFARRVSPSSPPVASVRAVRLPDARPGPIRRFAELATTPSLSSSAISVSICALESTPNRRTSPGRA